MIDTVVLTLTTDMFHITDPNKFTPSARWALFSNHQGSYGTYSRQNATAKELMMGIYKPRLTIGHRLNHFGVRVIMLRIEVSLPKLLLGTNFKELRYKDFAALVAKLVHVLEDMGIATTANILAHAPVSSVHYSKNIMLTDGSIPYSYINKIKEALAPLALDTNQTDYRNQGHSYKWHCNSYEIVFYDKIKELEKAKRGGKRALEKDNALHHKLRKKLQKRFMLEVLRMEVRINKRQKMKQLFAKLGINVDLTFKKLFKPALSKKVLLHYLNEIERKRPPLLDYTITNDKKLFVDLLFNNPDLSPKQLIHMYGLRRLLSFFTQQELRNMLSRCSTRTWYRLMADANKVQLPGTQSPFKVIREQLVRFRPVKGI